MRISDWSSDVCSSDLSKKNDSRRDAETRRCVVRGAVARASGQSLPGNLGFHSLADARRKQKHTVSLRVSASLREPFFSFFAPSHDSLFVLFRSEEHTSELQSLMRISYAVFCLKKKNKHSQAFTTHILKK